MQEYAKDFYQSAAWDKCRSSYRKHAGGLCERCKAEGKITPGVIVHHKEHITPDNITDPNITLNFDNLQLLCRDCHAKAHSHENRRYIIDQETGAVITRPDNF